MITALQPRARGAPRGRLHVRAEISGGWHWRPGARGRKWAGSEGREEGSGVFPRRPAPELGLPSRALCHRAVLSSVAEKLVPRSPYLLRGP